MELIKLIGKKAPSFSLKDSEGKTVKLQDFQGQGPLILYFYPKAMTPGCTVQAQGMEEIFGSLEKMKIKVLAVSTDECGRLVRFKEKEKLNFTLLSDPEHKVHEKYHVWAEKNTFGKKYMGALRVTFFIDQNLKIIKIMDKVKTSTHHLDVLKAAKELF